MTQEHTTGRHAGAEPADQVPYMREPAAGQLAPGPQFPAPTGQDVPTTEPVPPAGHHTRPGPGRSRFGGLWVGLIVAAVILVLLLVFILQNSQSVLIDFFGFSGQAPLAVAILLGVAAGALLVAVPGSVRILQLRRATRRE
jgi:uncharacterized integral membrane protein